MADPDYEGMLQKFLDKEEQKNSVPKKFNHHLSKNSAHTSDQPFNKSQNWAPRKPNPFQKNHRGSHNGSFESLDGSPMVERQNRFFSSPNHQNKPRDNSASAESVKAFLERMFQQHSSMVNTKLNTIMQRVSHFTSEVEKLKNTNAELQSNNKKLMRLLLEEKTKNAAADPQTKKKTVSKATANKKKTGDDVFQPMVDELLGQTTVVTNSKLAENGPVTRSRTQRKKKDESSSDEYVDVDTELSNDIQAEISQLRKKMDHAVTSRNNIGAGSKNDLTTSSKNDLSTSWKKDVAAGSKSDITSSKSTKKDFTAEAKKRQSLKEHERLMKLADQKIVWAPSSFYCESCFTHIIDPDEGEGVVLQECVHTICRECISKHILKNKEKDIIGCPTANCDFDIQESEIQELLSESEYQARLDQQATNIKESMEGAEGCNYKGCRGFVVVEKNVFDFVCPVCGYTNCLDCKKIHADGLTCRKLMDLNEEEKLRSHENWLQLNNDPLIQNPEPFDCPVCLGSFEPGEGVVLKNCLHVFCKECLEGHVENSEDVLIKCPHRDDDFSCDDVLQDGEIRALLKPEAHKKYLARSLKLAESNMKNTFHCLTPDCEHFCIVEDYPNFTCPRCKQLNCIQCKALHTGKTCRQHEEDLLEKTDVEKQADIQASEATINNLITQGLAMTCPNCGAHAMKEVGCDAIMCKCKTELCWATKGCRWGPRGTGDISGGCKCGVGGVRCHPNCQNCH